MSVDAGIITDFGLAVGDWSDTIVIMSSTLTTDATTGTETFVLSTLTTVIGSWQPADEQAEKFIQLQQGVSGRPRFLAMLPLTTTVAVNQVLTHESQSGQVIANDIWPGQQEVILKALD